MPGYSQNDVPIRINSSLGADALLVDSFEGVEAVSRPFEFRLALRSPRATIDPAALIGQAITFSVERADGSAATRYFNGIVTAFENRGLADRDHHLYGMTVRPQLWLLDQTSDCRIFQVQGQTALDIVKKVLGDNGLRAYEVKVEGQPPERDYVVQYNETDLAFVSRLLEEEGIYYYFRHEDGKHTLVLGNSPTAWSDCPESTVSYGEPLSGGRTKDRLTSWAHGYQLRPGKWAHGDYNFETPSTDLKVAGGGAASVPMASKLERFEYPGAHPDRSVGERRAKLRAEESTSSFDEVRGTSVCESFSPGFAFAIEDHHSEPEQGKRFALLEVCHHGDQRGAFDTSRNSPIETPYRNDFTAIPDKAKFRPARITPKPRIVGPQTAVVCGPGGEEIWTDKYGRVRVQFHWDRYGKHDENSSCWIRVSYPSAGGTWGMVQIPRIGHEVVVEFLNGDPDCPLVTGSVYNAGNMPPVSNAGRKSPGPTDMPGAKMMTSLRSNSLGGSGGHNEITMNDTGGSEGLFIKAQKDEIHVVGHDREDTVTNDETIKIGNDRTDEVVNNETRKVGVDRTREVGNNEAIAVKNNQTIDVTNDRTETVGNNETITIGARRVLTVNGSNAENISDGERRSVGMSQHETVGNSRSVSVGHSDEMSAQINAKMSAGLNFEVTAGMTLTLKGAGGTIEIGPAGIDIQGTTVTINGSVVKINC